MLNNFKTPIALVVALLAVVGSTPTLAEEQKPVVLVQFQLDAEDASGKSLTDFFDKILPATIAYEGNQSAKYFISKDDPSKILLLEEWDSQEDFKGYLDWRVEKGDFATLKSLLEAEPTVTFFER